MVVYENEEPYKSEKLVTECQPANLYILGQ